MMWRIGTILACAWLLGGCNAVLSPANLHGRWSREGFTDGPGVGWQFSPVDPYDRPELAGLTDIFDAAVLNSDGTIDETTHVAGQFSTFHEFIGADVQWQAGSGYPGSWSIAVFDVHPNYFARELDGEVQYYFRDDDLNFEVETN